jgi:pilus assembly protein Flp/PilA
MNLHSRTLVLDQQITISTLWPLRDPQEFAMKTLISAFLEDETAATAIEYGLIAAGISVAIIAVVNGLGTKLNATFSSISTSLK